MNNNITHTKFSQQDFKAKHTKQGHNATPLVMFLLIYYTAHSLFYLLSCLIYIYFLYLLTQALKFFYFNKKFVLQKTSESHLNNLLKELQAQSLQKLAN